ncbi:MAG: hypothetical protein Q9201_004449 [Fulgogasparrea decipioides]
MPSSPRTPTHGRRSSNLEQPLSSPRNFGYNPSEKRSSRKLSRNSLSSPATINPPTVPEDNLDFRESRNFAGAIDETDGLGNLADELAEAWDGGDGQGQEGCNAVTPYEINGLPNGCGDQHGRPMLEMQHDFSNKIPKISQHEANDSRSLSPPERSTPLRHQRIPSKVSDYDGSEFGDNSDLDGAEGISASLEHRLAAIKSLARRGTESNGSGGDKIVTRVAETLRDLSSQAGVETGASRSVLTFAWYSAHLIFPRRLTTAHTAVISNLTHQTRLIQTLSHHLFSPFSIPLTSDEIDVLLPMLTSTLELLLQPNHRTVSALRSLHSSSIDLISNLSMLADSLHMIRQTTSLASRKLKAAKETVDQIRKEANVRDEGIRWVEKGNWDHRLRNRECGTICGDVLDGFRLACDEWEQSFEDNTISCKALEVATG